MADGGAERRDVVVIGSGPAGSATALAIAGLDPAMAAGVLVLDKARHPRPKTCAGGLIPKTRRLLDRLGLDLDTVPNVRVDEAAVWTPVGQVRVPGSDLCRVVRRAEFDAALARAVRERGIELREGTRVRDVRRERERVLVETDAGTIVAAVVVGADGSGSLVRRRLVPGGGRIARAIMRDVPVEPPRWDGHAARRYEFDFRCVADGMPGYAWAFPVRIAGRPYANIGAYALAGTNGRALGAAMATQAARVGAEAGERWKAFPIHTYRRGVRVAAPRALVVGDAAGADALLGEGISFALEYGLLAGQAIVEAFGRGEFSFERYERAVAEGALGRKLVRLDEAARRFYGPRARWWFRAAHASARAQRIALAWYNGDPAVGGLGRWGLAARFLGLRPA